MTDLQTLRRFFKIPGDRWDFIIVTDGSGTTWSSECGSGAVLIQNNSFTAVPFTSGFSHGTNNIAELFAVLHPLLFLAGNKAGVRPQGCRVHVISDSEYVVNGLKNNSIAWPMQLKHNPELWMAIHMVRRKGVILESHHVYRDSIELNRIAHDLANLGRKSQIGLVAKLERSIEGALNV